MPRAPLPDAGVTHYQGSLNGHLREHYSSFIAHTDSCVRPNSSLYLRLPVIEGLCRLSLVPAGSWSFPTLSLQSLYRCLAPYPAVFPECLCLFLPQGLRSLVTGNTIDTRNIPCNATSTGSRFSRLQSFDYLQAPVLARPTCCTYLTVTSGQTGLIHHAELNSLPKISSGITT